MSDQDNKGMSDQGFEGLSSMVSEVETTIESARKRGQAAPEQPTQTTIPSPNRPSSSGGNAIYQSPPSPSGRVPLGKCALIFGGVILVTLLVLSGNDKKKPAKSVSQNYSTTPSNYNNTYTQPERFTEQMPSVGTNNVLTSAEIRYCLAEEIRMEGAECVVDNYDGNSVDRFNRMVNNYNSRCSQFRYRSGALESARSDVEPYRYTLLSEGRCRM